MLAKLIKFVIVTRFSKPLLGLMAFFLVYGAVVRGATSNPGAGPASTIFDYYAVGASVFFISMSLLLGGLFVLKSDRDYLLTLPLTRRDLSISLFIAQFVGSGITILFLYSFYVPGAGDLTTDLVLIVNLSLLACIVTSLSVLSNVLGTFRRIILAIFLAAWSATDLLGFPFTPVSAFTGQLLYGTFAMIVLAAVTVPVALHELAYIELGSLRTMLRATSSEYKRTMSFAGKSPIRAVYSYHLSFMELVGRMNIGGSTSFRTARVKTRTVLVITSLIALAYLTLVGIAPSEGLFPLGTRLGTIVIVLPIFLGVVVLILMSMGTFANERGWLAFTAMDPAKYLRHLLLSRFISILAIVGPFGVANLIIAASGNPDGIGSALVVFLTIPTASILVTYLVARVGAVQQVKEEGMMPGQFDLRQLAVILPVYLVVGLIIVSELFFLAGAIIAAILVTLSVVLLSRSSVWRGVAYRLTEKGFV